MSNFLGNRRRGLESDYHRSIQSGKGEGRNVTVECSLCVVQSNSNSLINKISKGNQLNEVIK